MIQIQIHNMGGCQNSGPLLGPVNTKGRIILRTHKGTLILTATHKGEESPYLRECTGNPVLGLTFESDPKSLRHSVIGLMGPMLAKLSTLIFSRVPNCRNSASGASKLSPRSLPNCKDGDFQGCQIVNLAHPGLPNRCPATRQSLTRGLLEPICSPWGSNGVWGISCSDRSRRLALCE